MNRARKPLRVTASSMPMRLAASATASGTCGNAALMASPNATATNTAGKIRPPRNPLVPATSSASSFTTATSASPPTV